MLGTTPRTLRQWDPTGELVPAHKTKGGTRYYAVADLLAVGDENAPTIGYARVLTNCWSGRSTSISHVKAQHRTHFGQDAGHSCTSVPRADYRGAWP